MSISRFYLPIRFIIGPGSLAQLGKETARLGKSALLVTGAKSMRSTGVLDKVINDLKANAVNSTVFDRVEPNPRSSNIDAGAKLAREHKADLEELSLVATRSTGQLVREELPVWETVSLGVGETRRKLPATQPRIVCAECHHALNQAEAR